MLITTGIPKVSADPDLEKFSKLRCIIYEKPFGSFFRSNADAKNYAKTTLEFSSADSLESSMSLVSGGISSIVSQKPTQYSSPTRPTPSIDSEFNKSYEVIEVIVNAEKGTREKRFKDGRKEIWYSNGNRYHLTIKTC